MGARMSGGKKEANARIKARLEEELEFLRAYRLKHKTKTTEREKELRFRLTFGLIL
jgi:hypothetical protein